jgi:hypothetical protein
VIPRVTPMCRHHPDDEEPLSDRLQDCDPRAITTGHLVLQRSNGMRFPPTGMNSPHLEHLA